ncbi:hypothetical protein CLU79DRAFT_773249 [Phycomyces nitens]|nr:hypothetical protein CLU79DRAFT_773249 [Phycomyces nitens]
MPSCSSRTLCITSPLFWFPPASSYPKLCSPPTNKPSNRVDWGQAIERDKDTWLIHLLCPKECYTHTRRASPVEPCICRGYCTIFSELERFEPSWPCVMSCSLETKGLRRQRAFSPTPPPPPTRVNEEYDVKASLSLDQANLESEKRALLLAWLDSVPEYSLSDEEYSEMPIWQDPNPVSTCPPGPHRVDLTRPVKKESVFGILKWVTRIKKGFMDIS